MSSATENEEAIRLRVLDSYGVLDTPEEQAFNDVARLAAVITGAPMVSIGFVDRSRVWIKAGIGMPGKEVPRDLGFCPMVVARRGLMMIPDTHLDPAFSSNPLIHPPINVRSYLGVPLRSAEGFILGSFCVIDKKPRNWTEIEQRSLSALADQVGIMLELRRKLATEEAAHERLAKLSADLEIYKSIFANSIDGIGMIGIDGHGIAQNDAHRRILGYSDEDLSSATPAIHLGTETAERVFTDLRTKGSFRGEVNSRRKDGRIVPVEVSAFEVTDDRSRVLCYVGIKRDISVRRETEARLRESEARFRSAFENSSIGMAIASPDFTFVKVNRALAQILEYEPDELIGRSVKEITDPDENVDHTRIFAETVKDGVDTFAVEKQYVTKNGRIVWGYLTAGVIRDDDGRAVNYIAQIQDITRRKEAEIALGLARDLLEERVSERTAELLRANEDLRREMSERRRIEDALKRSEEQLAQSQKMEAIGKLAGGIAHEFNNLLQVIRGHAELAQTELEDKSEDTTGIDEVISAADRAALLTRQLLAFSRHQVMAPRVVDVNELIRQQHQMLARLIGEPIHVRLCLGSDVRFVRADPNQFAQALLNLVNNAIDAMPHGGSLTIATDNVDLPAPTLDIHNLPQGRWTAVRVTDTGVGIAPDIQNRIFDPFFTTKEIGKGTGLGLSTVYGIIAQSGGHVRVESEPGKGSTFTLYLPSVDGEVEHAHPTQRENSVSIRGTESILVAEDDEGVRSLVASVLRANGYRVAEASSGAEALRRLDVAGGHADLLLTDVAMPEMSGRQLAVAAQAKLPALRVLFMTGNMRDAHAGGIPDDVVILEKPFSGITLARSVRRIFDQKRKDHRAST